MISGFVCSLEWWSYEAIILLSGLLPNPKLEASVLSIWYANMPFFVLRIAFLDLLGNYILWKKK